MTPSQWAALGTAILVNTDPTVVELVRTQNDQVLADWYNGNSAIWVWRSTTQESDIFADPGFNWTLVDGLTQGKRDQWTWLFRRGYYNSPRANQRAAIVDVWSGTAPKLAVQAAVLGLSKRLASNVEAVFTTTTDAGAGANGAQATPLNLTFEGAITANDIAHALRP